MQLFTLHQTEVFAFMSNSFNFTSQNSIQAGTIVHRGITILDAEDDILRVKYPYNVELCRNFFSKQDQYICTEHHPIYTRIPLLLVKLDGISDWSQDCRTYIQSDSHQQLYGAVAFVLSSGNITVLERHYLKLVFSNQLYNKTPKDSSRYPIGIFENDKDARRWLRSKPARNHIR